MDLWISFGIISVVVIFLTGFLTWPPSIDFLSRRPSDIPEVRRGVEEMIREWEAVANQEAAVGPKEAYWAIDTRDHTSYDGGLRFVLMREQADGEIVPAGGVLISNVAPTEDVLLVGDYGSCNDWMNCYGKELREAIERRKNLPTVWDRLNEESA